MNELNKLYEYVRGYIDEHGYPPSVRDIQEGLGIASTSTVHYRLNQLERAGLIRRVRDVARGIVLA